MSTLAITLKARYDQEYKQRIYYLNVSVMREYGERTVSVLRAYREGTVIVLRAHRELTLIVTRSYRAHDYKVYFIWM
jgi:hypothetical protein